MVCDVIDYGQWCHMPDLWCHRCFSSHMISHTMTYDVTGHFWPTYDIIWHGMWCHMSCTHLVTYDVIAIYVIIQLEKCRPPSPWVDMTSHTMSYDIIAHGMWRHRSCTHFVIYDVISIYEINLLTISANVRTTCLWHHIPWPMTS